MAARLRLLRVMVLTVESMPALLKCLTSAAYCRWLAAAVLLLNAETLVVAL